ncbi:protein FAR1-RELATED SEQUENCE 7-like [Chenopodium quinoa]|uniref:protein FAR1-RELATED SEQUENCE 7-like n=1 Tax=Chenopodium quinoa TaxID=63459 RepID=UPI000B76DA39|nr:protein FAR1-RELATED SEQUENCE 7-like [Chenopodium quinoa]
MVKEYRIKKITSTVRKRLLNYYEVGVPMSQIRGFLRTENENLPNVKDLQHEVLDEEGRLKDVMWVDARSRVADEDFGDVVLSFLNEDCDTYRWVFEQWVSCMGNKAPVAILTDQAAAMRKPLAEDNKVIHDRYNEFKNPLKNVIYDSFTVNEFISRWNDATKVYGLEDNEWLQELFIERHM